MGIGSNNKGMPMQLNVKHEVEIFFCEEIDGREKTRVGL